MRYILTLIGLFVPISMCLDCFVYMDRFTEESYLDKIVEQIKKCNYKLTKITIINTKIKNIDFLNSVRHIETLHGGYAILISDNRYLRWNTSSFKELKSIKSPHHHQEVVMITISNNINLCVDKITREKLRNALLEKDKKLIYIQPCMCEMNAEDIRTLNTNMTNLPFGCEVLVGNLYLNEDNTRNKTTLAKLNSVKKIYGRIEVYETKLKSLNFLARLATIDEREKFVPHVEHWTSSLNATLALYHNYNLTEFGLKKLKEIYKNHRTHWIVSIRASSRLLFTEKEERLLQRLSPNVKYDEMRCYNPSASFTILYVNKESLTALAECVVLSANMIVFNETSPSEEDIISVKWKVFNGCLLVSNTNYSSLNFLRNIQQINCSDINEIPAVNISNNALLENIDFDAVIIGWNSHNISYNETVHPIDIRDNPLVCDSSIEQLMNHLRVYNEAEPSLLTEVFFIGSADNATCNYKNKYKNKSLHEDIEIEFFNYSFNQKDSVFILLLSSSAMFSTIFVGMLFIFCLTWHSKRAK